ncbi:hypothetical protein FRC00_004562, partial [Tulasnella sp. 408]
LLSTIAAELAQDVAEDVDAAEATEGDGSGSPDLATTRDACQVPRLRLFFGTQKHIPLGEIFDYKAVAKVGRSKKAVGMFWDAGRRNTAREAEVWELLSNDDDDDQDV